MTGIGNRWKNPEQTWWVRIDLLTMPIVFIFYYTNVSGSNGREFDLFFFQFALPSKKPANNAKSPVLGANQFLGLVLIQRVTRIALQAL